MIKNYLLPAIRSFKKHRLHATINVFGLSLGITASLLAFIFIQDELSFDKFHTKADRIYRLNKVNKEVDGSTSLTAETSGLMGPTMVDEFPEVEKVVRYQPWFDEIVLSYKETTLLTKQFELAFTDSTFFEVFSFNLLRGDVKKALSRPKSLVLTESAAKALFPNEDAMGKVVTGLAGLDFEVTGIMADLPRNSHMQFSGLMSWSTTVPGVGPMPMNFMNNWIAQALCTYVLLKEGTTQSQVESKFAQFMQAHLPERVEKYSLYLQPFSDLYLKSQNVQSLRMAKVGNIDFIYLFSVIAGFILFIACVNYVNISTSRSTRRAKEVGMRKTLGAARSQLISQFLGEALLMTISAAIIAFALLYLAIPFFNNLAGKSIPLTSAFTTFVFAAVLLLVIIVTVASGLYPAFIISAFKPSEILRSSGKSKLSGNWPRYTLITFQFVISIVMIAGTLLVYQQIKFVLSKDLGFEKEHTLVVDLTDEMVPKGSVLQEEVNALTNVTSTSLSRRALGRGTPSTYVIPEGFAANEVEARMFPVDFNFLKTYGMEMANGRFFDEKIASDSAAVIINEAMMRRLNWKDGLQKTIRFDEGEPALPVIGVIKDFHFASLYNEVEPLIMWISPNNRRALTIRFSGNPSGLLQTLESQWKKYESRYPFAYYFVDQEFAKSYQSEEKLLSTVMTFASVSIIIACLGLYGLVSFTIEQRTKEFGIRRVLGASISNLNLLVSKKFIVMVLVASGVAIPVVLPFINKWLQKFAFKINIGPGVFLVSIIITLTITLIAIGLQSIRVARMNPTDSLRQE